MWTFLLRFIINLNEDIFCNCIWQKVAEETKAVVQKEEEQAIKKTIETQTIADDAQRDLNEALPALVSFHVIMLDFILQVTLLLVYLTKYTCNK